MKGSTWKPLLVLVFSPVVWLLEFFLHPGGRPFFRTAEYSDVLVSHLPISLFVHEAISKWGQVPLWNPLILAGSPLAADPLAGFWYPPQWLAYLFPSMLTFQILFVAHLAWAGVGTFLFLRSEGLGAEGALLGALAFSGTTKFAAHIGLGHVGLVSAVSWTPWALLFLARTMQAAARERPWAAHGALAGACLGMVFIADPRWSLPVGMLVVVYALHLDLQGETRGAPRRWLPKRTTLAVIGVVAAFALLLSACLSLPLLEFVRLSTRPAMDASQRSVYALPAARILGFIVPLLEQPEWVIYLGVPTVLLALMALFSKVKGAYFWFAVGIGAAVLALGDQTPLYAWMGRLVPGLNLLRVPARFIFLTSFCAAVLSGKGLDKLLQGTCTPDLSRRLKSLTLGLTSATVVTALYLAVGLNAFPKSLAAAVIPVSIVAALLAFLSLKDRAPTVGFLAGWILVLGLDLALADAWLLDVREVDDPDGGRSAIAMQLASVPGSERVFSPSYSIPQHISARAGLQMADGVNPLQLRRTWSFMSQAVGFDVGTYSVTLPPFPSGNPRSAQIFTLDLEKLGQVNVRYIVSDYALPEPELTKVDQREGIYVYSNPAFKPRAWIEADHSAPESGRPQVEMLSWSANVIRLRAQGPGRLVLSEVFYPGWTAEVDGRSAKIDAAYAFLRALELEAGEHDVVIQFQPYLWLAGAGISLLTLVALGGLWLRR